MKLQRIRISENKKLIGRQISILTNLFFTTICVTYYLQELHGFQHVVVSHVYIIRPIQFNIGKKAYKGKDTRYVWNTADFPSAQH
jgi:hypothetical protein